MHAVVLLIYTYLPLSNLWESFVNLFLKILKFFQTKLFKIFSKKMPKHVPQKIELISLYAEKRYMHDH